MAVIKRPETIEIDLPHEAARMIREALASGLYGDSLNDAIIALLRPGLMEAVRIGAAKLKSN